MLVVMGLLKCFRGRNESHLTHAKRSDGIYSLTENFEHRVEGSEAEVNRLKSTWSSIFFRRRRMDKELVPSSLAGQNLPRSHNFLPRFVSIGIYYILLFMS